MKFKYLSFNIVILFISLVSFAHIAWSTERNRWQEFYKSEMLDSVQKKTAPDILAVFEKDILPALTPDERIQLRGVNIEFPRDTSYDLLNFYSVPSEKRIIMPVLSLRFLKDILTAYAWLLEKGYDIAPVTEYLCMIKYQWPNQMKRGGHTPLEALGVPDNVLKEEQAMVRFQEMIGTAVVFILGHELGHIYYKHVEPDGSLEEEKEADAFALSLLSRIGEPPVGAGVFFYILSHLELVPGDHDFESDRANRIHPLSSQRIEAVARSIKDNATYFSSGAKHSQAVAEIVTGLEKIAHLRKDDKFQTIFRLIGTSARLENLRPRRLGEQPKLAGETHASATPFSGNFSGKWIDAKGTDIAVKMVLNRDDDKVTGDYILLMDSNNSPQHTPGFAIPIKGTVQKDVLEYEWRFGADYFGKGELRLQPDGHVSGTWGYNKNISGGGTWQLSRP